MQYSVECVTLSEWHIFCIACIHFVLMLIFFSSFLEVRNSSEVNTCTQSDRWSV